MKKIKERSTLSLKGHVTVQRVYEDDSREEIYSTKNVITYQAGDIMARMLGRDLQFIPSHIGFLYGPTSPGSPMPNPSSTRDHTIDIIATELLALGGNMIISPIGTNPAFDVDGDAALYEGNAATLTAISDSGSDLIFSPVLGYASDPPQSGSDEYYQVVLLARTFRPGSSTPTFYVYARTQLASGTAGIVVQANSELAAFWQLSFQ